MTKVEAITEARKIYEDLGSDSQVAFAVIRIAQLIGNDLQSAYAILLIARFLTETDKKEGEKSIC